MWSQDKSTSRNKQWGQKMVEEKCGFTRPWLDLTKKDVLRYRSGALNNHEQLQNMFPAKFLCDVDGVDVLCLASGL